MSFYLTVSRIWCTCFVMFEDVILIFLRDLKIKFCKHNQKEVESVHFIKVYTKGRFVYVQTSDTNLLYQLCSKPLTHQGDFDLKYTQDILLFHSAWFLYHYTQCTAKYGNRQTKFMVLYICKQRFQDTAIDISSQFNIHLIYLRQKSNFPHQ